MRKIIVQEFSTLDGVVQAPGGPEEDESGAFKYGGWTAPYFEEADKAAEKFMQEWMRSTDIPLGQKRSISLLLTGRLTRIYGQVSTTSRSMLPVRR